MLADRVRKRGWVLIISSGTNRLLAAGPGGSNGGSVKLVQPRRGKEVIVRGISVSFIWVFAIIRLKVSISGVGERTVASCFFLLRENLLCRDRRVFLVSLQACTVRIQGEN